MRTLKEIAYQLKRIADSLMLIEITLLKSKQLKYTDIQSYAKDYNEISNDISKIMANKEQ